MRSLARITPFFVVIVVLIDGRVSGRSEVSIVTSLLCFPLLDGRNGLVVVIAGGTCLCKLLSGLAEPSEAAGRAEVLQIHCIHVFTEATRVGEVVHSIFVGGHGHGSLYYGG